MPTPIYQLILIINQLCVADHLARLLGVGSFSRVMIIAIPDLIPGNRLSIGPNLGFGQLYFSCIRHNCKRYPRSIECLWSARPTFWESIILTPFTKDCIPQYCTSAIKSCLRRKQRCTTGLCGRTWFTSQFPYIPASYKLEQ